MILAAAVLVLSVVTALTSGDGPVPVAGWVLVAVSAAALAVRRRHPIPVLAITSACALLYYPLGYPDSAIGLGMVVALFTVARYAGRVPAGIAALLLAVAFAVIGGGRSVQGGVSIATILVLAVVLGEMARIRARSLAEAQERAALAEATRESEARERALGERMRIARELHDVLAHQVSLINVQAGAALHIRDPEGAFAALGAIRTASGEALRDVRAVLGVLNQAVPTLADLPDLVSRTEAAGLPVHLDGDVPAVPAEVGAAAYRIVQEALTNAVRHACASRADVRIRRDDTALLVTVADDGAGPPAEPRPGHGLRGMAERAAGLGGAVETGPGPGGGFLVTARLPVTP